MDTEVGSKFDELRRLNQIYHIFIRIKNLNIINSFMLILVFIYLATYLCQIDERHKRINGLSRQSDTKEPPAKRKLNNTALCN